ncbi:MAG: hypothetical protein LV480_00785 [Methylacidiphilales bacterium]|nr:hypothetical protein [Candidatus Methylacidiphilales bacterium]
MAVALLLLAIGAATLAYFFPPVSAITGVTSLTAKGQPPVVLKAENIASSLALWDAPVLWQESPDQSRLFDSEEYLFYPSAYPGGDYIKKVDPDTRSPSGVLLRWYKKYGLNFTDPNVDREDPDNDGFSNIVEFKNDPVGVRQKASDCDGAKSTDPRDPKSHPSYLSRLRLQQYEPRSFHILFEGYNQVGGHYVFELRLKDVPSYNQPPLKQTGDQLGFEGYVVGAFHEIHNPVMDPNTNLTVIVDQSTLELDKPDIGFSVVLPFQKEIDSPESTADFVMLMPTEVDKVIKIARGKVFTVPYITDTSFLLISADDKGAKVRDTKTKQEYPILKLDPAEWNEVPVAPQTSPASP